MKPGTLIALMFILAILLSMVAAVIAECKPHSWLNRESSQAAGGLAIALFITAVFIAAISHAPQ